MQHHLQTREEADASLARFFADLGHDATDPLSLTRHPRLSDAPVHETLSATVVRLRAHPPAPKHVRVRLFRRDVIDAGNRTLDLAMTVAIVGITGFVLIPAAFTLVWHSL